MEQQPIVDPQQVVAAAVAQQQQADAVLLQQQQQQLGLAQQEIAALRSQLQAAAASSSSSFPLAPAHAPVRDLKPLKPSTFAGGAGANAEQWLLEMERYFQAADSPQSGRVLFASTFLKESASAWFNSLWIEAEREVGIQSFTWPEFKERFRARFRPLAASRTARSILRALKQKYRVASYTDAFLKQMQLIPDMSMADQVDWYINGLQDRIAEEVDREDPNTLVEAMNLAQRAETRLATRRGQSNSGRSYTSSNPMSYRRTTEERYRHGGSGAAAAAAADDRMDLSTMDLDSHPEDGEDGDTVQVMQQHGPSGRGRGGARRFMAGNRVSNLSREEFDQLSREGKCFQCRQPGHLARNCPKSFAKPSSLKSGN